MKKVILVLSMIFSFNANAMKTGNEYFAMKEDSRVYYFLGVFDLLNYHNNHINKKPFYCLKEGVSKGQLYLMFNKYLNENPIVLSEEINAPLLILLAKSFPCQY